MKVSLAFPLLALVMLPAPRVPADQALTRSQARLPSGARIAVVALNSTGGGQVDRVVGDMLTSALRRAGVVVVERLELDAVLREQRLARDGVIDPGTAVQGGKVLGAEYLLGAKATEFGVRDDRVGGAVALGPLAGVQIRTSTARVVLDARLLDVRTGRVLLTDTVEGKQVSHGGTLFGGRIAHGAIDLGGIDVGSKEWSESTLGKAARKAVDSLVRRLAGRAGKPQASVMAVLPSGEMVVGLGTADGVHEGDRLQVCHVEAIRDSKGDVVWIDERPLGEARVVEARGDRSRAVPVGGSLGAAEGDLVKKR